MSIDKGDDFIMETPLDSQKTPIVFKALCDSNRVRILQFLMAGEKCACRLLEDLKIGQPTLSHHMKILCDSGLVVGRKEGKWMHYSISRKGLQSAMRTLNFLAGEPEQDVNEGNA